MNDDDDVDNEISEAEMLKYSEKVMIRNVTLLMINNALVMIRNVDDISNGIIPHESQHKHQAGNCKPEDLNSLK